jgi:hypothetical protein
LRPSALSPFRQRHSIPRAPSTHLSKSPVDKSPSSFSSRAPMEIDACLQNLFYLSSRVPKKPSLQVPFT